MSDKLINDALKLVRLYWGYSQAELSQLLGISQSMISEIEKGKKNVTLEVLEKYSTELGIKKSQLMFFAEELEDEPTHKRGRLIVANKAIELLQKLAPRDRVDGSCCSSCTT